MISAPVPVYKLRKGDTNFLQVFSRRQVTSDLLAVLRAEIRNEFGDRHLILTAAHLFSEPAAAQSVHENNLFVIDPDGTTTYPLRAESFAQPAIAGLRRHVDWQGTVILPPRWQIRAESAYNSGVAANAVVLSAFGYLIPLGNLVP